MANKPANKFGTNLTKHSVFHRLDITSKVNKNTNTNLVNKNTNSSDKGDGE